MRCLLFLIVRLCVHRITEKLWTDLDEIFRMARVPNFPGCLILSPMNTNTILSFGYQTESLCWWLLCRFHLKCALLSVLLAVCGILLCRLFSG